MEIIRNLKNKDQLFLIWNPSMKFQNLILKFKCTHGRTGPKQYAPSTFSKLWGIKRQQGMSA